MVHGEFTSFWAVYWLLFVVVHLTIAFPRGLGFGALMALWVVCSPFIFFIVGHRLQIRRRWLRWSLLGIAIVCVGALEYYHSRLIAHDS
jgi:hypothetical protein